MQQVLRWESKIEKHSFKNTPFYIVKQGKYLISIFLLQFICTTMEYLYCTCILRKLVNKKEEK